MPTIEQIRAARALLGWNQDTLAQKSGMSQTGIARIENGTNKPNSSTLEKIETAFDGADVEFISDTGVKKRTGEIRTLRGSSGFKSFLDDVYDFSANEGGLICLHNSNPMNWIKWLGEDEYKRRSEKMQLHKDKFEFRITTRAGESNLISSGFAEYRLLPENMFNDQSIYTYGDCIAFINFQHDDVTVRLLKNKPFAEGFQALFNIAWENLSIDKS